MLSKAFWIDAGERVFATVVATVLGVITADGFNWVNLDFKQAALGVLSVAFFTLLKCLAAGLANPNTGASLGTTVPGELVSAFTTQKTIEVDRDVIGGELTLAHPGDTVAGPAALQPTGTQVVVVPPAPTT